jgi:hypothetical protein
LREKISAKLPAKLVFLRTSATALNASDSGTLRRNQMTANAGSKPTKNSKRQATSAGHKLKIMK